MPINVQPSVTSDPSVPFRQSAAVLTDAQREAARQAQIGQQAGERGLQMSLQSAMAQSEQTGANARQAQQIGAEQMQAGMASMERVLREQRQQKLDREKEEREVKRETDKNNAMLFVAANKENDDLLLSAMDRDGNIPDAVKAAHAKRKSEIEAAHKSGDFSKMAETVGASKDLNILAAQATRSRAKDEAAEYYRFDGIIRDQVTQNTKDELSAETTSTVLRNSYISADRSAAMADEMNARLKDAPDDDWDARSKAAAPALFAPIASALPSDRAKTLLAAIITSPEELLAAADAGGYGPAELKFIEKSLLKLTTANESGISPIDDKLKNLSAKDRAAIRSRIDNGVMSFVSMRTWHPNLMGNDPNVIAAESWEAAKEVAKKTGQDPLELYKRSAAADAAAGKRGYQRPPGTMMPTSPTQEAAEGVMGPPAPQASDMFKPHRSAVSMSAAPEERKAAQVDEMTKHAQNLALEKAVGGDAEAISLVRKFQAQRGKVIESAEKFGREQEVEAESRGFWSSRWWNAGYVDESTRAAVGREIKNVSEKEMGPAMAAAALFREGKMSRSEAEDFVEDIAKKEYEAYKKRAVDERDPDKRAVLLKEGKKASRNAAELFRLLSRDAKLYGKIMPEDAVKAVRDLQLSEERKDELANEFVRGRIAAESFFVG